jgi:hypothetical protein
MSFFDRIFGNDKNQAQSPPVAPSPALSEDQAALQRYRYMLQTAPPETVEQAHEEAFKRLTPEQRRMVLTELGNAAPAAERNQVQTTSADDPKALARLATRAEYRQPGFMERTFGGSGLGFGTSLLSSFAMGFVGSMVAQSFFSALGGFGDTADAGNSETADASSEGDEGGGDDGGGFDDFDGGFEV